MKNTLKRACRRHLTDTFGMTAYRPGQMEAVEAILAGKDVICILPTGAGKSLCWQLPAVVHGGVTIVVSPLIALMRDQVRHLEAVGVPAISLDSLLATEEKEAAVARIRAGTVKIVFVSPERLEQPRFRKLCREISPWLVVVDEAHCVVQWGEGFRPAYMKIAGFLGELPQRPVMCALTATADETTQAAICSSLSMRKTKRILLPILRENLIYEVRTTLDRTGGILQMLRRQTGKTVIFCRSRGRTERLCALLENAGYSAACYHAGMDREARVGIQQWFMNGKEKVLCATTAFGLGVDIPDIRSVIHDHLPDTLIDFVQQSGRAGRDGKEAYCTLLITPNDLIGKASAVQRLKAEMRRQPFKRWQKIRRLRRGLQALLRVVITDPCIPAGIAAAFGKRVAVCGSCSACLNGALLTSVPDLTKLTPYQVRLWILMWQRDAIAARLNCHRRDIASDYALQVAAKKYVFPSDETAPPELERLLAHFRHEECMIPESEG